MGLPASVVAHIAPQEKMTCLGQWMGMALVVSASGALMGPMVGGLLYKEFGANSVGWFTAANLVAAAGCMGLAVRFLDRNRNVGGPGYGQPEMGPVERRIGADVG